MGIEMQNRELEGNIDKRHEEDRKLFTG